MHGWWVDGEPNWNENFASETPAPLPLFSAVIVALAHMRARYDVNDDVYARMRLVEVLPPRSLPGSLWNAAREALPGV
jgi:hypothetical protein